MGWGEIIWWLDGKYNKRKVYENIRRDKFWDEWDFNWVGLGL